MTSKTRIANMMLGRIGASKFINNIDTERGKEATVVNLFFDDAVDYVLRDFPWPFATSYADLALVAGDTTAKANKDWSYSYRYPTDCLYVRRVVVETVGRNNPTPPPFRIGRDSQGRLIYTNEPDASIEYTSQIDNIEEFDSIFVSMLAWNIGASCSPTLSRVKGMAETCMQMYEIDKSKAQARSLNEGQQDDPLEAELMRSRD